MIVMYSLLSSFQWQWRRRRWGRILEMCGMCVYGAVTLTRSFIHNVNLSICLLTAYFFGGDLVCHCRGMLLDTRWWWLRWSQPVTVGVSLVSD